MECGRDSALTSKHPGPLRPNKYTTPSHTGRGGAGGRAGLELVLLRPKGSLNPFRLGRK